MKARFAVAAALLGFILPINPCYALIKPDDNSIDLAIKYGIKTKGNSTSYILGSNWIQDSSGSILNIYSPFIQIAMKTTAQNTTGNIDEDAKIVKEKLKNAITTIKEKNEIRFILSFCGETPDFSQNYKAYIIDASLKDAPKIKPKKSKIQKTADKDNFDPKRPFSAVNCYTFKFDDVSNLKDYYFIVASKDGKEIKYKLNNNDIY